MQCENAAALVFTGRRRMVFSRLQLRASGDQSLASFVAFVLGEVLDESGGEVLRLLIPFGGIGVGVARIEDLGTPFSSVGTSKPKYGIFLVGAFRMSPFRIASMMPRVSLMEMRLPVPFQPVLTR